MFDFRKNGNPEVFNMGRRVEPKKGSRGSGHGRVPVSADENGTPADQTFESREYGHERSHVPVSLLVIIVLISGAVSLGWYFSKHTTVKDVAASGFYFTNESDVLAASGFSSGQKADSLDLMASIISIEKLPYVRQASIDFRTTGGITIHIRERKPLALMINGNRSAYVDEDGVVLPVVPGKAVNVPLVYGFRFQSGDTLKSESFGIVSAFLVQNELQSGTKMTISEIAYTASEGIVALNNENGVRLIFGHEQFGERLRKWEAFYTQIVPRKGINRIQSVDLRYNGQIVTRET